MVDSKCFTSVLKSHDIKPQEVEEIEDEEEERE